MPGPLGPSDGESEYGCEGDTDEDDDLGGWRMRVPMALLQV